MLNLNEKINEEFNKFEFVVPFCGKFEVSVRKAGESILKKGPVVVDENAVIELQLKRVEVERFKNELEAFLRGGRGNSDFMAFYMRKIDN